MIIKRFDFDEFRKRCDEAAGRVKHYALDADHAVIMVSMDEWVEMFRDAKGRTLAQTMVDGAMVSTVFLGIDHNWSDRGPPIVFESMTFPHGEPGLESDCDRYATWDEAVAGHAAMVRKVRDKVVQFRRKSPPRNRSKKEQEP